MVAVVAESPIVRYYAAHDGKGRVQLVGTEFNTAPVAMAFQLDSPLCKKVDLALLTLRGNDKWFGTPKGQPKLYNSPTFSLVQVLKLLAKLPQIYCGPTR